MNIAFPYAWRYRDYVIDAFNADKPYDEFLREQIAGDLLPASGDQERSEHLVATGFLAIGTKGLNEQNPRQFALDVADEQVDTLSQAVLGMTVACARCHDHKFDPIPQRDYYALAGIFTSTETRYGTAARRAKIAHAAELIELPKGTGEPAVGKIYSPSQIAEKKQQLETAQADLRQAQLDRMQMARAGQGGPGAMGGTARRRQLDAQKQARRLQEIAQAGMLDAELKSHDDSGNPKALAMGAEDLPVASSRPFRGMIRGMGMGGGGGFGQRFRARAPEFSAIGDCALYARGDVDKPGEKVPRGFPSLITLSTPPSIPREQSGRLQLAEWITDGRNPLTARVMTNRVWKWIFGEGIVTSTDNFGTTGNKPSNQALLDTLALDFQQNGWSVKKLVREIVMSHAYQLGSAFDDADFRVDPENALVWHMSKRRLDAECIRRDAMLSVSGQLDLHRALPVGDSDCPGGRWR